ncbi:MAG: hypothetical protein OEY00_09340, partial [Gammaproteobacteria bacterium]|nr:hypothetical protein [Gammaproteobacteria bacterium]
MHHPIFWFATALLTMFSGLLLSAYYFPGGFDWGYQVASALMSQKHNPIGGHWFAAGMCLAMLLLLPYVKTLRRDFPDGGAYLRFLQVGVIFGALMGAERLFIRDLSHLLYKSHEFIALMTFLGIYIGQLGLLSRAYRQRPQL